MIKQKTITVVECDSYSPNPRYPHHCFKQAECLAILDVMCQIPTSWTTVDGKHFCPECSKKFREDLELDRKIKAREVAKSKKASFLHVGVYRG